MMKFNVLNKNELVYEASIRGLNPAATVHQLRTQLGKVSSESDPVDLPTCLPAADDLEGCDLSLVTVKDGIRQLDSFFSEAVYGRMCAFMIHLDYRFARIERPMDVEESSILIRYDRVAADIREAQTKLKALHLRSMAPVSHQDLPGTSTSAVVPDINITCMGASKLNLSGIKFDGKSCVRSFLRKAGLLMASRSITPEQMLKAIPDIFCGDALTVVLAEKFSTWEALIQHLRSVYDRPNYDFDLLDEIKARTQGVGETISVYLAIMKTFFNLLEKPLSPGDQLEIVLRNIHPSYIPGLSGGMIADLADLQSRCKLYEGMLTRSEGYKHPPTQQTPVLVPELAYATNHGTASNRFAKGSANPNPHFSRAAAPHNRRQFPSHPPHQSHKPVYCYGCNNPGFTLATCPRCNSMQPNQHRHMPGVNSSNNNSNDNQHHVPQNKTTKVWCFRCNEPNHHINNCTNKFFNNRYNNNSKFNSNNRNSNNKCNDNNSENIPKN